jgi:hypothetical protein
MLMTQAKCIGGVAEIKARDLKQSVPIDRIIRDYISHVHVILAADGFNAGC